MESVDLSILATLDALLQECSVTGAARRVGISTPAMSHALARIRERLADPILVRAGRQMVLTPRAELLKPRVNSVVNEARQTLAPQGPFVAATLRRTFVIHSSDYVLTILGATVDRMLTQQAPGVHVRFIANSIDDPAQLRDGGSDLAVGIYGDLPQEMRSRQLITDRFVCVVRDGHPFVGRRLSLQQFTGISHVQIAPRGKPGGYVDDVLRAKGHTRTVARAVPYFLTALQLTAETDYLLTISERIATRLAPALGLRILEIPLVLRPYALSLVWHPRFDGDAGHRFLRETFALAADQIAGDRHKSPRTRLDPSDPTSGQTRKLLRPVPAAPTRSKSGVASKKL
jgi:DNA-binding transcriptional LysR family regulator